jgi:siroheme synthase
VCTLATLPAVVQQQALASPAVLVIGDVAAAGAAVQASDWPSGQVQAA